MARILLVDSDDVFRRLLSMALSLEKHAVIEADSGEAALERVAARDIDVIVTELMLPVMDGMKFLSALPATVPSPPPCLVLTAAKVGDAEKTLFAGTVAKILRKPIEGSELAGEIRALLRSRRLQSA